MFILCQVVCKEGVLGMKKYIIIMYIQIDAELIDKTM